MQTSSSILSNYWRSTRPEIYWQTSSNTDLTGGFSLSGKKQETLEGSAPKAVAPLCWARSSAPNLKEQEKITYTRTAGSANQYFQYADETGIIDYNGIIFYCDSKTDTLKLGDCSNASDCIQISLTGGGSLMVNRDNLDQLFDALSFFSPEDMMKILQVLQKEKMADNSLKRMEQEENRILELVKDTDDRERKTAGDYWEQAFE